MRRFALALLALCLFNLVGCIDYREQLTLKKDGSGSLRVDFLLNLEVMNEISKVLGEKPDPEATQGPSEKEIKRNLKVKGITVRELKVRYKGTKTKVHIVLDFDTLATLRKIEGFGNDRKLEFFEGGKGKADKAWVIYTLDTKDVIPLEEFGGEPPRPGEKRDPIEVKLAEITQRAQDSVKFRAKITLPGKIHDSNGKAPKKPNDKTKVWIVDKKTDPKRHKRLGRGKLFFRMLVDKSSLGFVKSYKPLPKKVQDRRKGKAGEKGHKDHKEHKGHR